MHSFKTILLAALLSTVVASPLSSRDVSNTDLDLDVDLDAPHAVFARGSCDGDKDRLEQEIRNRQRMKDRLDGEIQRREQIKDQLDEEIRRKQSQGCR